MSPCQEINRPLVSVKLSLFCWFGALSSAQIYLTIYLKSLSINAQTTALVTAVYPLSRLIGPTISGPIADKMGRYKPILYVFFSLQILMSISLLFIPYLQDQNNRTHIIPLCTQELMCSSNSTKQEDSVNSSAVNESYICLQGCPESETLQEYSNHKIHCLCRLQENQTVNQLCYLANSSCHATKGLENGPRYFLNDTEPMNTIINQNSVFISLLLASYCIYQLSNAITYAMMETSTLAMVKRHNGNYGKQRVWAIIGMSIFSPISGILVDYVSAKKGFTDYSPAFYISNALTLINIISVFNMDLKQIPTSKKMKKDIYSLCKYRVWLFLSSLFFHGIFYGYIETYLFWYLQDMGSPKYLMGLTLSFVSICALPLSHLSKKLIDKFGCISLITVAFFISSTCNFAYSYLSNPWFVMLIEMPNSAFYHLMWISAATHSSQLVPDNLLASVQSVMVMSHYGLGRGVGTLIGGNLIYAYGEPVSFRCMGVAAGIVAGVYSVLYYYNGRSHGNCHQLKYSACGCKRHSLTEIDSS